MNAYEARAARISRTAAPLVDTVRLAALRASYADAKRRARKLAEEHPFFADRIRDSWNEMEAGLRGAGCPADKLVTCLLEDVVFAWSDYIYERATDNGTW